jgi:signal transduction histidine kinase
MIFLIILGTGSYLVLGKYKQFKDYALNDKINDIQNKKLLMKDIVESYINQANQIIASSEQTLDRKIVNRVKTAYQICSVMYEKMKSEYGDDRIKDSLLSAMSGMVYGNEYIYVMDMDGVVVLSPLLKNIEGKNLINRQDAKGHYTVRESIDLLKKKGEGFIDVFWENPADVKTGPKRKRVFMKRFEPYDWMIGYGVYVEDHDEVIKNEVIKHFESVSYDKDGYLFAATYDGISLTKPAKGRNMYDIQDSNGKYLVRELIKVSKNGGGFVEYEMPPFKGARPEKKLSYAAPIERWNWYIGTGIYITDIETAYNKRMGDIFKSEKREIAIIIAGLFVLLILGSGLIYFFSRRLQELIDKYSAEIKEKNFELSSMNHKLEIMVDDKTSELNKLNQSLEQKVEEEVEKNREKDRIMFQQGRLAAMGEMIGNIAHQWRQPLSSISLLIQDIQEAHDVGELNSDYLADSVAKCTETITHMSDTIDNFRYFFNPQKEKSAFDVDVEIRRCLSLLDAGLENNNIKVNTKMNAEGNAYGVPGEYSQVLVNVLNNAKDVLLFRNVINPRIDIESHTEGNNIVVEILDNGGGIEDGIIDRVFEPYFTTKSNKNGTGIGLYFSKMIIDGNMKGALTVENRAEGACFKISVPSVKE